MPEIRPSTDLRNHYNEISEFCRSTKKPVFITRNGRSDVTVLSTEEYDRMAERAMLADLLADGGNSFCAFGAAGTQTLSGKELLASLDDALKQVEAGEGLPSNEAFADIRRRLGL